MNIFRTLSIIAISAALSACGSVYDVWQGYDDIEPDAPVVVAPARYQENSELNEAVRRASVVSSDPTIQDYEGGRIGSNLEAVMQESPLETRLREINEQAETVRNEPLVLETVPDKAPEVLVLVEEEFLYEPIITMEEDEFEEQLVFTEVEEAIVPVVVDDESYEIDFSQLTWQDAAGESALQDADLVFTPVAAASVLTDNIKYNKGSHRLSPRDMQSLKAVSEGYVVSNPRVVVKGYAVNKKHDVSIEEALSLMELANTRADKVREALVGYGIDAADIETSAEVVDAVDAVGNTKGDVVEIYFEHR